MKIFTYIICLFLISCITTSCTQPPPTNPVEQVQPMDNYTIAANSDLHIQLDGQTNILEINALLDSQIIEDDQQRLLILSDPSDQYRHGILARRL